MEKSFVYWLACLIMATSFVGCSKEAEENPEQKKDENWTPTIETERQSYTVDADGGTLEIIVRANGTLTAELYPLGGDWARVANLERRKKEEYAVTVAIDRNERLGRIASLSLRVDGKGMDVGPCIVQKPAIFGENVEVEAEQGMLQVLLGYDMENLSRIRHIKITGGINALDYPVIKSLCQQSANYPIEIDLSDCGIKWNDRNPYEYYGWTPKLVNEREVYLNGEIPTGIFTNSQNLVAITLPNDLKYIAQKAFEGCTALKRIVIPDEVEEIRSYAFYGCSGLEDIELSEHSNLVAIGYMAFTTKSLLRSLRLPITLTNIDAGAFLGCSVSELHVGWQEPPALRILPNADGCTLYVPKGTADIYRTADYWSEFTNVVEEESWHN